MEWYHNLSFVLYTEDKLPFLEQPIHVLPVPHQGQSNPPDVIATHQAWVKAQNEIVRLMLMTMDPEIQKTLEHLGAYDVLNELKTLYVQQANQELLQTAQEFHACKQEEVQSFSSYVLKMKSYIDNLKRLGHAMTRNLSVSLILVSLRKEYDSFVQNYNMHSMGKTVNELHDMLKLHEKTLLSKEVALELHDIRAGRIQKNQKKKSHKDDKGNQGKGKAKIGYSPVQTLTFAPKPKNPPTPKKDNLEKDAMCHQCGEGLRGSRKLKPRALSLYVSDGHRAAVEAIGDFHLCLPSGLVLILHNCHYAPSTTRRIISVSRLYKDGFINRFENDNLISVCKNNMIYFNVIPQDVIYKIVMSSSNTNECSMYDVTNKRAKFNLNSALLWHYRVGHINKKRIEKLQHDGLLDTTDIKSFENCVAYTSGKMARKPYSHQVERAKDLLGLIHTNVCGPFKIISRQGAYYFITFIDDFSRYGYVYLLKHKHEMFETFKVFQKEVENQLEKTIKSLCSDRGDRLCLYVDAEEHELGDLGEPANYKAASLDPEFEKWLNAMNVEMQSMKDNEFRRIDYEETFSPIADIRAIRILIDIVVFYDYEIWQMDVKTAFLNGYLNEENITSRFQQNPGDAHWTAVKNILKYLRNTKDMFLVYEGVVDWKSTKQGIFATSSTDTEHIAAFDASKEAVWIRKFISGLGIVPTIEEPINMYCDNTRAIAITKDHGVTKGARHFHAKAHYLRKTIEMGDARIEKVDTYDNLVGPFTKALVFLKHSELTEKIEMIPASSLM
nr:zinc finger, CCHC-type [Tanacetum cinerariifolium]